MAGPKHIEVEKLGGLAGFGLPGARLRSRGKIDPANLAAAERAAVETLFSEQPEVSSSSPSQARDAFRYRLTRHTDAGPQSVEVAEAAVPASVRNCVTDELA